jgi:large subunit ribosomal protein L29
MEIKDLKGKDEKELQKLLQEKRDRLRQLRFELSQGKVKNIKEIRGTKKEIARMLTALKIKDQKPKIKNKNIKT